MGKTFMSLDDIIAMQKSKKSSTTLHSTKHSTRRDYRTTNSRPHSEKTGIDGKWKHDLYEEKPDMKRQKKQFVPVREKTRVPELGIGGKWKHDMYEEKPEMKKQKKLFVPVREKTHIPGPVMNNARVLISGLPADITVINLEELFSLYGCTNVEVHYDAQGASLGTAEITFASLAKAKVALNDYAGVRMDGFPLEMMVLTDVKAITKPITERISVPHLIKKVPIMNRVNREATIRPKFSKNRNIRQSRPLQHKAETVNKSFSLHPLDPLAEDDDYIKEQKKKQQMYDLDRDLDAYMKKDDKSVKMDH